MCHESHPTIESEHLGHSGSLSPLGTGDTSLNRAWSLTSGMETTDKHSKVSLTYRQLKKFTICLMTCNDSFPIS